MEICDTLLLLLGFPFLWYACFPKSFRSVFGQNPWTIVRGFDQISFRPCNFSLEGAMELKFAPFCTPWDALSDDILFVFRNSSVQFLAETP